MCTLNIKLSDTLMDRIRPSFPSQQAILAFAQKQLEMMLIQYAEQRTPVDVAKLSARHKHETLCGIFSNNTEVSDLRDEYIKGKYGL